MRDDYVGGVAFIGQPGSGKSSISEELRKILKWDRLSFAAQLRNEVAYALNLRDGRSGLTAWADHMDQMVDPATKDKYRPLLQAYGSFRRAEDPDYWVNKALADMEEGVRYVIDDCRYRNEYEALRARGFKFVHLMPGPTTRPLTLEQAAHESERDWPYFLIDIDLTYEAGPRHQAERIAAMLRNEHPSLRDDEVDTTCPACGRKSWQQVVREQLVEQPSLRDDEAPGRDCPEYNGEDCCRNFEGDEVLSYHSENLAGYKITGIHVSFDPPYIGDVHTDVQVALLDTDEPVVAVPV